MRIESATITTRTLGTAWLNSALPAIPDAEITPVEEENAWYVASLEFRNQTGKSRFYLKSQQPQFPNSYVCEYLISRCPSAGSNTRLFSDRCYISDRATVSWYEARNRCLQNGGDMASFANVTSIDFTSWLGSDVRYWIGLRFTWYIWIASGLFYLVEGIAGVNEFRRCYNTSDEMHCLDLQYDNSTNRWLTASFDNARQRCNDLKSTLIIIKDEETNSIVQNYISDTSYPIRSQYIWMDAYRINDYNNSYTWHWLNSNLPNKPASELSTPDYTTWYVAALEFDSGKSQFYLKGQQPHFPNSYVCEYAVSKCSSTGSNLLQFADRCYISFNASVSWYEARNRCLKDGGDLASFENITSIDFTSWLGTGSNVRFWIGLRFTRYIWKDSGEDVKFSKWMANWDDWISLCLILCPNCTPSSSWLPKDCTLTDSIYVVCHSVTPHQATTLTTARAATFPVPTSPKITTQTMDAPSNSSKIAASTNPALGVGVGVGVGVPVVAAIIVIVICVVRLKTPLAQMTRNGPAELGAVQKPSGELEIDSANDQYQQLNRNLDNSSRTIYDKLRVEPETQYEEFPSK